MVHIEATGVPDAPALLAPAGATVSQLFTVPHDRKRKREEGDRAAAAAAAAAAAQQQTDGGGGSGAANGSPVAAEPEQSRPASQFPISHYVLSYKVSRLLLAGCVAKPGRRCLVLCPLARAGPTTMSHHGADRSAYCPRQHCHCQMPASMHSLLSVGTGCKLASVLRSLKISAALAQDMEAYNFPLPFLDDDGSTECPPGFVSSADPGDMRL